MDKFQRYNKSKKGKARSEKYRKSKKGKAVRRKYAYSKKGKEARKRAMAKYRKDIDRKIKQDTRIFVKMNPKCPHCKKRSYGSRICLLCGTKKNMG